MAKEEIAHFKHMHQCHQRHFLWRKVWYNIDCIFLLQTCKTVYDRIIDLRIATPQNIMNYGLFLEENNYFEEAFKVITKILEMCYLMLFLNFIVLPASTLSCDTNGYDILYQKVLHIVNLHFISTEYIVQETIKQHVYKTTEHLLRL